MPKKKTAQTPVQKPERLSIRYPLEGFSPEAINNLKKMVEAKAPLIKMALGAEELPITVDEAEGVINFPWFNPEPTENIAYYTQFVTQLCQTAKEKKRVTAAARDFKNPRFSFRVFLIGLGMVGAEFGNARKCLCKALPGNAAWSSGIDPRRKGKPETGASNAETAAPETPAETLPEEQTAE